jgi:F0F1-type ATP synthase assembly protein I
MVQEKNACFPVDFPLPGLKIPTHQRGGNMSKGLPDPRELGFYFVLGQVGLEMVVPILVGALIDYYLGWTPWVTLVGVVLGFIAGLGHLFAIVNRRDGTGPSQPPANPS